MFPVEEKIGDIRRALAENRDVVLTAPPGSGKTTIVPPALLEESWLKGRKIVVLEPRRLAARNCAQYIAAQRGEPLGGVVGYRVRLESKVSAATRLEIITEGLLAQRILSDPELADTGLIIFDEFHERALACDLAFALALEVRRALRPDLRLLVMSATLDAEEVVRHLGDAVGISAQGRMYPVETRYLGDCSIPAAVSHALKESEGDILCFLPGEGEIRRAQAALDGTANAEILPLYGALPKAAQDRVFTPSPRRKVILATSIAETSLTLQGITCVIDSGLMRVPRFSPATGMTGLVTLPLTLDRAEQRRGRAGRVQAGVCYRLWHANEKRPERMNPEIMEADLTSLVLTSAAWGALKRTDLPWMTPPPASAWEKSVELLKQLGVLSEAGALTPRGERMSHMPLHPRLANMLLDLKPHSTDLQNAALLAAIVEEGRRTDETDIRRVMDEIRENPRTSAASRILALARRFGAEGDKVSRLEATYSEGALLARAYPDRVAKNRGNGTFRLASGRGAFLDTSDRLAKEPWLVACTLDDRMGDAKIFLAAPLTESEVRELFATELTEEDVCFWDKRAEQVVSARRVHLGAIVLAEKPLIPKMEGAAARERIAKALVEGVRQKGVANLPCWTKESLQFAARLRFLHRVMEWPELTDSSLLESLVGFVDGIAKWRDLEKVNMTQVLSFWLTSAGHTVRELDTLAPARMQVPSGSHLVIHYEGDEPTVEAKLQECFGLMTTPRVADGRVPIVMTLLSPAQRPIQITKDLAGFWREGYALVRKEMRGRYPRHYWPEDPFTATPTRRTLNRPTSVTR